MLLQYVSTHGGHLQAERRNLFYISVLTVLFYHSAIGIPHALQLEYENLFVLYYVQTVQKDFHSLIVMHAGSQLQSGKTTL